MNPNKKISLATIVSLAMLFSAATQVQAQTKTNACPAMSGTYTCTDNVYDKNAKGYVQRKYTKHVKMGTVGVKSGNTVVNTEYVVYNNTYADGTTERRGYALNTSFKARNGAVVESLCANGETATIAALKGARTEAVRFGTGSLDGKDMLVVKETSQFVDGEIVTVRREVCIKQ